MVDICAAQRSALKRDEGYRDFQKHTFWPQFMHSDSISCTGLSSSDSGAVDVSTVVCPVLSATAPIAGKSSSFDAVAIQDECR